MDSQELTQEALAEKAGVSYHTVFRAVTKGKIPLGKNISKIAKGLGVSEGDLFQDPSARPPSPLTVSQMTPEQLLETFQKASGDMHTKGEEERELLTMFRLASPAQRTALLETLRDILAAGKSD